MIKKMLKPLSSRIKKKLDTSYIREEFVVNELKKIQKGSKILDAGCGAQPFRKHCDHMEYFSQDFAMYESDQKGAIGASRDEKYNYGKIDYIGDIWNIDCESEIFDAVLCTEVFEHIPYPIEAINELSRVLKPGGTLILTLPGVCLRHMDPYFFYTGFSDRWLEKFSKDNGLVSEIHQIGDYYEFMAGETFRVMASSGLLVNILLLPSFIYYFTRNKTEASKNSLTNNYILVAKKRA